MFLFVYFGYGLLYKPTQGPRVLIVTMTIQTARKSDLNH